MTESRARHRAAPQDPVRRGPRADPSAERGSRMSGAPSGRLLGRALRRWSGRLSKQDRRARRAFHTVLLARSICVFVLTVPVSMGGWAVYGMARHMTAQIIVTGSMEPGIRPGDVVLAERRSAAELQVGHVIVVHNPAHPGHLLTHRLHAKTDTGELVTKGDANPLPDSTPVAPGDVVGEAKLLLPMLGEVRLWVMHRDWVPLATTAAALLTAVGVLLLVPVPLPPAKPDRSGRHGAAPGSRLRRRRSVPVPVVRLPDAIPSELVPAELVPPQRTPPLAVPAQRVPQLVGSARNET